MHPDPLVTEGAANFANVTLDVVQSANALAITNVRPAQAGAAPGSGSGTIDPASGVFSTTYGYTVLFEPIGTRLDATASADGLDLIGSASVIFALGPPLLYDGPVVGVRVTGPSLCGNGRLELGETCDDDNTTSGDGCSAACVREPRCGDRIEDPGEDCDDGNTLDGDGCSATCVREPRCGNGFLDPGEECDDGSTDDGDACSPACQRLTECGNALVEFGEQCDDGNTADDDCCSVQCRFTTRVCRPSIGPCDIAEICSQGTCPPDSGNADADADGLCDGTDPCRDVDGSRGFVDRPGLTLMNLNDGVAANERLSLRATFYLSPSTPFAGYDPTTSITIVQVTSSGGTTVVDAALPPDEYGGPGTRGWGSTPTRRRWDWRDATPAPIEDIVAVRISALQTPAGERVRVRVKGRANPQPFGLPGVLPDATLPLQANVTLGSFFHGLLGRCGQSRFTRPECSLQRDRTRLVCKRKRHARVGPLTNWNRAGV